MLPFATADANSHLGFLAASQAATLHSTATGQAHSLLHNSATPASSQLPLPLTTGQACLHPRVR